MEVSAEVVISGGGPAGASLAFVLANAGISVTLLERSVQLRDPGLGELIYPWGTRLLSAMGLMESLPSLNRLGELCTYYAGEPGERLPWGEDEEACALGIFHPTLRAELLSAVGRAGGRVIAPARVSNIGSSRDGPVVEIDGERRIAARLVVVADGRHSLAHRAGWAQQMVGTIYRHIVSARVIGLDLPHDALHIGYGEHSRSIVVPYGTGAGRIYTVVSQAEARGCRGADGAARLMSLAHRDLSSEPLGAATVVGPIFVQPARSASVLCAVPDGIVLIGDAAGYTDPCMSMGLSIAIRDAYTLGRKLCQVPDWPAALSDFRAEREFYFAAHRAHVDWNMQLWFSDGAEARAARMRVLAARSVDPSAGGWEDIYTEGVTAALRPDDAARQRFFGECVDDGPAPTSRS